MYEQQFGPSEPPGESLLIPFLQAAVDIVAKKLKPLAKVSTRLDLKLTEEFHRAAKAYADENGISIAEVFRRGAAELMGRKDLKVRPRGETGHTDVIAKAKRARKKRP